MIIKPNRFRVWGENKAVNKALGKLEAGAVRDFTSYLLEVHGEVEGSALMWYKGKYLGSYCIAFAKRQFVLWG